MEKQNFLLNYVGLKRDQFKDEYEIGQQEQVEIEKGEIKEGEKVEESDDEDEES